MARRKTSRGWRPRERGAAIVEFSLFLPLLLLLVMGIFEFGMVFDQRLTISNVNGSAARVGSTLGDRPDADLAVLQTLDQGFSQLPNQGIGRIRYVDIYLADAAGEPLGSCSAADRCNRYFYEPVKSACGWSPCPDPDAGYGAWPWAPTDRDVEEPSVDSIGVRLTFAHQWAFVNIVPVFNVDCDGSPDSTCWYETTVMRMEPTAFDGLAG